MAKKLDIDWKNLLLQKGEKIGFGVALVVLILFMVFGVKGMFSGSPPANAKALDDITSNKKQLLASNKPRDMNQFEVDPSLMTTQATLDPINPDQYRESVAYYIPFAPGDTRRREPKIEKPVELVVQYVSAMIRSLAYGKDFKDIWVVRGTSRGDKNLNTELEKSLQRGPGGPMGGMMGARGGPGMGGPGMGMMGARGGGMMGGPGMGMMGARGGGMMGGPQQPRNQQPTRNTKTLQGALSGAFRPASGRSGDDKEKGLSLIRIDELSKHNDARPAERVLPGRMLLFQGAFPLRKQLENMKSALHTATLGDAFRELRFVGVEFERREIGPDGKPITEWSASSSDGVRFEEALRTVGRLSAINVQSAEEDEEMAPLIVRGLGLVYRLPLQFEGRKYPSPNIKELNETVKAIKEKGLSVEVAQDSTEVTQDDLLADGAGSSQQGATSAAEGTKPIGGGSKSPGGA